MGARGPVPKPSSQSRHHSSKAEAARIDKPVITSPLPVVQPPADSNWHQMATDWYLSLAESGQSAFYQPSDWQTARVWAEVLSRQLASGKMSAVLIATWSAGATELLTTEGARRRARLELQRHEADPDEEASVTALADYRAAVND